MFIIKRIILSERNFLHEKQFLVMIINKGFGLWRSCVSLHSSKILYWNSYQKIKREAILSSLIYKKIIQKPQDVSKSQNINSIEYEIVKNLSLRQQIIHIIQNYSSQNNPIDNVDQKNKQEETNQKFQNNIETKNNLINVQQKKEKEIREQQFPKINLQIDYDIFDLFTKGIIIPKDSFNVDSLIHHDNISKNQKQKQSKLFFCPTYLTTKKIFWQFACSDSQLIVGNFGIGKTYSCLLYKLLSDPIHRYRKIEYQNFIKSLNQKYPNGNKLSSLQIQKAYPRNPQINYRIPKVIYIFLEQNDTKQTMEQKILSQCFQLQKDQINQIKQNLKKTYWILKQAQLQKIYSKKFKYNSFRVILIIDKINIWTDSFHLDQLYITKLIRSKSYQRKTQKQKQKFIKLQFGISLRQLQDHFRNKTASQKKYDYHHLNANFSQVFYIGHPNIQYTELEKLIFDLKYYVTQPIKEVTDRKKQKSKLHQLLDFVQFFGMNFQNNQSFNKLFKEQGQQKKKQIVQKIKKECFDILKSTPNYLLLSFVNECIQQSLSSQRNLYDIFEEQKIKSVVLQILNNIKQKCEQKLIQNFYSFLKKCQTQNVFALKLHLLLLIQNQLKKLLSKKIQNSQQINKFGELCFRISIEDLLKTYNFTKNEVHDSIDKNIFRYNDYICQGEIQSLIPFNLLVKIFIKSKKIITQLQFKSSTIFLQPHKLRNQDVRQLIELSFKDFLRAGQSNISWKISDANQINQTQKSEKSQVLSFNKPLLASNIYKKNQQTKTIQKVNFYGFIPIPEQKQMRNQFFFLNSFKQYFPSLIKKSKQSGNKNSIFYPLKEETYGKIHQIIQKGDVDDDQIQTVSKNNQLIDFVSVQILKDQIILNVYDFQIEKREVNSKINTFVQTYLCFKDKFCDTYTFQQKQSYKLSLNYIVISPHKQDNGKWQMKLKKILQNYKQKDQKEKNTQLSCSNWKRFVQIKRSIKQENQCRSMPLLLSKIAHISFDDLKYTQNQEYITQRKTETWQIQVQQYVTKRFKHQQ